MFPYRPLKVLPIAGQKWCSLASVPWPSGALGYAARPPSPWSDLASPWKPPFGAPLLAADVGPLPARELPEPPESSAL